MAKFEISEKTDKEKAEEAKYRMEHTDPAEFRDIFEVRGVPKDKEAFWGNTKRDMLEMSKYRDKYEVVNSNNAPGTETVGKQVDGTHQIGDAILMMRPKSIGDKKRAEVRDVHEKRRAKSKAELYELARQARVKLIDDERK